RTAAACSGRQAAPPAADVAPPWFVEVGRERGIDFTHTSGHRARYLLPESVSGGGGWFDMDGDGDLDVYLVQGGSLEGAGGPPGGNRLYENQGAAGFRDVTAGSGAEDPGYGMGLAAGDYDGDGAVDLYVTHYGRDTLLRNEGAGKFRDATLEAGLGQPGFSSSAGFFDYDRDGDLDLFVARYVDWRPDREIECLNADGAPDYCSPRVYRAPAPARLYRNEGDGRFRDVSVAAGLSATPGTGLGVLFSDVDGDGWLDVYVANDGMPNRLWINRRDGTFVDRALVAGCAVDLEGGVPKAGMGVAAGDIDEDGDIDLMVCNLVDESDSVFRNDGGSFTDVTARVGLAATSRRFTRFGQGWVDFDNDGRLDLYQANGRIRRAASAGSADPYAEPNLLYRGRPQLGFEEVLPRGGTRPPLVAASRAAAFGDMDNDGGIDVLVVNRDAPAHVLHNVVPQRGHWILLRVVERSGRDAEGARVRVRAGGRSLLREVRSAGSYLATSDPRVHVGLGAAERVDEVEVQWVDGARERFGPFGADRVVTLRRSDAR
ncbi:MAG TPA: CRTAC1 family protein, partial [Candidatus Polarisedimenticolaceae bacterium]|nr:CRTAC1 family protein [Candidatus Polarisedimenticolaceae bacterium]